MNESFCLILDKRLHLTIDLVIKYVKNTKETLGNLRQNIFVAFICYFCPLNETMFELVSVAVPLMSLSQATDSCLAVFL